MSSLAASSALSYVFMASDLECTSLHSAEVFVMKFLKIKLKFLEFDLQGGGNTIASVRSEVRAAVETVVKRLILEKVD